MKAAAVTLVALLLLAGTVAAEGTATLVDRLNDAERTAPDDAGRGLLYEKTAKLLEAAREMPDGVELVPPPPPEPSPPPQTQQETPEQPPVSPEEPSGPAPQQPQERPWVRVLDRPVVEEQKLAHTYYLAERYPEAAALYRGLHEADPGDRHVLTMLFLSERNAGNGGAANELLARMKSEESCREWAVWTEAMMLLSDDNKGEEP